MEALDIAKVCDNKTHPYKSVWYARSKKNNTKRENYLPKVTK